jgi:hypothetical protein
MRAAVAAAGCVVVGAIAGIAGAAASTSTSSTKSAPHTQRGWYRFGHDFRLRGLGMRGMFGRAVHVQATVLDKAGTGFITVTEDNGTVQSVSGNQLTIKEAVEGVTYRTVTLTIPSGATVVRNFQRSTLSALRAGDRVRVVQSSDGTTVFALDTAALPRPPALGSGSGPTWAPPGAPSGSPPSPPAGT